MKLCSKIKHHVIGLPRTLVCFGAALSGLKKNLEPVKKSILSIDLQPQSPETNYLCTWQSPEAHQSTSFLGGGKPEAAASVWLHLSPKPQPAGKSLNTTETVCSNSGPYKIEKPPINKQQQKFTLKEWTKNEGGVPLQTTFFSGKNS